MPFNPYASPQAQDASRMPQTGFGQSNPSPQYGGVPNQNAFQNANSAANLYSRFGAPSDGAPSFLPGGAPTSSPNAPLGFLYFGGSQPQQRMPFNPNVSPQINNVYNYVTRLMQTRPDLVSRLSRFGITPGLIDDTYSQLTNSGGVLNLNALRTNIAKNLPTSNFLAPRQ